MNLLDLLADQDRAIRDLRSEQSRLLETAADRPTQNSFGSLNSRPNEIRIRRGIVADYLPFYNWYIIHPDDGGAPTVAAFAHQGATHPLSARQVGTVGAADAVYILDGRSMSPAIIIAVEPRATFGRDPYLHEYVTQASATTPAGEPLQYLHRTAGNQIGDRSTGAPFDETGVGEKGFLSGTGTGLFVDPFLAFLRADEDCGVWAFLYDRLLRLSGRQLQLWTPPLAIEAITDNIDLGTIEGRSNYLWESLGRFASGASGKKIDPKEAQVKKPWLGGVEPQDDKQIPFRRILKYGGRYGGGGERRIVCLPPEENEEFFKVGGQSKLVGVYDETLSDDGGLTISSARGVLFAHVPPFPVDVLEKRIEDGKGDKGGSSAKDKIADGPQGELPPPGVAGIVSLDHLAYVRNWTAEHPFKAQSKEWFRPSNDDFPAVELYDSDSPPQPTVRKVDHRHDAKYYSTLSCFGTLPDGTVIIAGPGGQEIILAGNDVLIRGRNVVIEASANLYMSAGRNATLRAHDSIDLAAATGDVRVKADRHAEFLAGNSGQGALILESRSAGTEFDLAKTGTDIVASGVVIRSKGLAGIIAGAAYFRSTQGQIVIDAGRSSVETRAGQLLNHVTGDARWMFSEGQTTRLSGSLSTFSGSGEFNGSVVIAGSLLTDRSITVASGHIATSQAKSFNGKVASLEGQALDLAREGAQRPPQHVAEVSAAMREQRRATDSQLYASGKLAHPRTVDSFWFSFRSTEQCDASDFKLHESRWAAHARIAGLSTSVWTEPAVVTAGDVTYPFPGRDAWVMSGYVTLDPCLFDLSSGRAPDPSEDVYGSVEYKAPQIKPIDGNYPIES